MPEKPMGDGKSHSDPSTSEVIDAVLASSRALIAVSARSIADSTGVTLPQYRMLVVLDQAPSNLTGLAAALDVAPSTAMRMIDRLIVAGLVERTVPEENRRETHLTLTRAGQRTVATVTERRRRDVRAVIERVPRNLQGDLARAMAAFAAAAEETWPSPAAE
ncbi:MAG: MarR family transcriptional regulator [Actinomycetota bacterium]|nr:MarR family transcriptional regulator [Actinomycetota bacterium]MDQ2956985.1 MarR family transcriptional regulator [Actinomycetota bacterium]